MAVNNIPFSGNAFLKLDFNKNDPHHTELHEYLEKHAEDLVENLPGIVQLGSISLEIKNQGLIEKIKDIASWYLSKNQIKSPEHFKDYIIKNYGYQSLAVLINIIQTPLYKYKLTAEEFVTLMEESESVAITYADESYIDENLVKYLEKKDVNRQLQSALEKMARKFAKTCPDKVVKYFEHFRIQNEIDRVEIALMCAKGFGKTAENINKFNIQNEEALIEIAKECAKHFGEETACYIKNFKIQSEETLIEIAKMCAKQSGTSAKHIKNFEIQSEEARIGIAKESAIQNVSFTACYIKNFEIQSEEARIGIAKACAKQDGQETACYIKNFEIQSEEVRIEIAKACAQQDGTQTALYIEKFKIGSEEARIEIAKECAKQSAGVAFYILNFGISSHDAKVEIAMECAKRDGLVTAGSVRKFLIKDEQVLIKIAKECNKQSDRGISTRIGEFRIKNEEVLIEIAKECAKKNARDTVSNIVNFGIRSEEARIEIAKECARQNGESVALSIKKFDITSEKARLEIAKECIKQNLFLTAFQIKNFEIQSQSNLIELAQECEKANFEVLFYTIHDFGITSETVLIELATRCANQNGASTAQHIQNFKIRSQEDLLKIAIICAKDNAISTAENIKNFAIQDAKARLRVFHECFKHNSELFRYVDYFSLSKDQLGCFYDLYAMENTTLDKLAKLVGKLKWDQQGQVKKMLIQIQKLDSHAQEESLYWFLQSLYFLSRMDSEGRFWVLNSCLWDTLGNLHAPNLRSRLTALLFDVGENKEYRDLWSTVISENVSKKEKELQLIILSLFSLYRQKSDAEILVNFAKKLLVFQKHSGSKLHDIQKMKSLFETVSLLGSSGYLSDSEKRDGFLKLAAFENEKCLFKNIQAINGLIHLKNSDWTTTEEDLSDLLTKAFEQFIPLQGFKGNVSELFEEHFTKSRNPAALVTYGTRLKSLKEPEVINCLGQYVQSVFEGSFKDLRYQTSNNPHLAQIFEKNQDLLGKWKINEEISLESIPTIGQEKQLFDPVEWLKTRLFEFKHLETGNLHYLTCYLKEASREGRAQLIQKLSGEIKDLVEKKANSEPEGRMHLNQLFFESACLKFASCDRTDQNQLLTLLGNIQKLAMSHYPKSEFSLDVKSKLQELKNSPTRAVPKKKLKVVISDDPIDLLLCGTDVMGSCQRVEGSPNLNRGLLGYMMDGKNILLAIKDGDKIVSRCILSILWDGDGPVLYRERFYPDNTSPEQENAMNFLAKKRAKELGVPIVSAKGTSNYQKTLKALGGSAPYEYSDAAGGVKEKGRYEVNTAFYIN